MDLSRERWDNATLAERQAMAAQLARQLPEGFELHSLRMHSLGGQARCVALYQQGRSNLFALIPGGQVTLGYDGQRPWQPNADEAESWRGTAEEYGFEQGLEEHLARVLAPSRQVNLAPMLMEVRALDPRWAPLCEDHPEALALLRKQDGPVQIDADGRSMRVRVDSDGSRIVEQCVHSTHAQLTAALQADGFQLPTADEWEHACGAGAPTLFRWGDHVPCDRYPVDLGPAETAWQKDWKRSAGLLGYPPEGFDGVWDLHLRPNAFGLFIAFDPYQQELLAEPGRLRGGDGGSMVCGGAGFFAGWLPLATAYAEADFCTYPVAEPIGADQALVRRVLALR